MKLTKNTIKRLIKEEVMQEESEEMQTPTAVGVVHIVMWSPDRIPEIEGVFSTREKAEAYIEEEVQDPRRTARAYEFQIDQWYIDPSDDGGVA